MERLKDDLAMLLEQSRDPDPELRRRAVRALCPCRVKRNERAAWDRVFEMTRDEDPGVRRNALHGIIDGLPHELTGEAVAILEAMRSDAEPRVRRQVRKILARHHRSGRISEG